VVGLPSLVLGAQVKGARVLQVGGEDDGLVASLTGQLNTQVPRVERDESKLDVVLDKVFLGKLVEAVDGVAERACIADVLPGEGGKAGCGMCEWWDWWCWSYLWSFLLHRGVMGVLTGLTRTLSR
jgi:hypothetical protein